MTAMSKPYIAAVGTPENPYRRFASLDEACARADREAKHGTACPVLHNSAIGPVLYVSCYRMADRVKAHEDRKR